MVVFSPSVTDNFHDHITARAARNRVCVCRVVCSNSLSLILPIEAINNRSLSPLYYELESRNVSKVVSSAQRGTFEVVLIMRFPRTYAYSTYKRATSFAVWDWLCARVAVGGRGPITAAIKGWSERGKDLYFYLSVLCCEKLWGRIAPPMTRTKKNVSITPHLFLRYPSVF